MGQRIIATLRTWIAVPTFFLFTLGISATISVYSLLRPHHPAIERVIHLWSRAFLTIAPIRFEGTRSDHLDSDRQYVFVSNHLSTFDIPVLFLAVPHRIRYLAKAELFKIPILAGAMRRIGIIKINRGAGPSSHAAINDGVAAAAENGYSLIVFSEGTRSRDGELHEFKKGAFRIAIATGMDIVPVAVHGTWDTWRPDAKVFFPGTAEVVIGDPIPVADLTLADIDSLRDQTRNIIADAVATMAASSSN
ncbi:MAG: lysophospholipid acyltransferase family protein [Acidimicrobiia bacterium]|nr:lysophospholipid acyltransferase family protein [Acidimicrobiia bacterium]